MVSEIGPTAGEKAGVSFEGQTVIVTGAGSGLGRTYALDIARRGGAVVVNDLGGAVAGGGASSDASDKVVEEICRQGGKAVANCGDVASPEGARSIAEAALASFGRIDALINNAGNMRAGPFETLTLADLNSLLAVHVAGAFNVSQAVWPHMKAQQNGRIVFTSSGAGVFGNENLSAYGAAKGGVMALMHVLSLEGERHGILCNAILPNAGTRMTSIFREGDLGENPWAVNFWSTFGPEFTTGLAVFLASKACSTTHGMYSALGGRIGRTFIGVADGYQGSRSEPMHAEEVAANWDVIRDDARGYGIPESLPEENRLLASKLGL
jgi:NAD(P)-dependent dehydrogenase (short-subunit alcohol dehydrogenase family)